MEDNLLRAAFVTCVLFLSGSAWAQGGYNLHEKGIERLNEARNVAPLSVDTVFGDQISHFNGNVTFANVDISVPGNNTLPVELRRSLLIDDRSKINGNHLGGFAEWDLDIPSLSSEVAVGIGWRPGSGTVHQRCGLPGAPPSSLIVAAEDYWGGYRLQIPGTSSQQLLSNPDPLIPAADGGPYPWVTKDMWRISCKTSTKNGYAGQAFIAISPTGVEYHLDWVVTKAHSAVNGELNSLPVHREVVYFLVSRIEDRFGNWVDYTYSGDKLSSIVANDGRQITLTWVDDKIVSAASSVGTWGYAYIGQKLSQVTRPDTSKWSYASAGELKIYPPTWSPVYEDPTGCPDPIADPTGSYALTITAPSGAVGQFSFDLRQHYRSNIPEYSCFIRSPQYWFMKVPRFHWGLTLISKVVTGPGLPAMTWAYSYGSAMVMFDDTKKNTVSGPGGTFTRYTYGTGFNLNEGQLLAVERGSSASSILNTVTNTYVTTSEATGQNFPDAVGSNPRMWSDLLSSAWLRPLKQTVTTQQGVDFTWQVNNSCSGKFCFNVFGKPTEVRKHSTLPGNPSRTEVTEYAQNYTLWVLNQASKTTCKESVPAHGACDNGADSVMSETTYDATWALPLVSKRFGKTVQTLSYDTAATVASGQRGTVKTAADGAGNVITLSSWKRGVPQSIKFPGTPEAPSGATQSAVVNDAGWITSVTEENGFVTGYGYDAMGRLASVTYPSGDTVSWAGTTQAFQQIASAEYGIPAGHWRQTISTGNGRKVVYFDGLWRPLITREYDTANESGTQRFQRFTYDHAGRTTFASYPATVHNPTTGSWSEYDTLGRPTSVSQDSELGLLTTTTAYLAGFQTRVTNPRTYQTTTSYQAWDQPGTDLPLLVTHPAGAYTHIARDVFGKPTQLRRSNSGSPTGGTVALNRTYTYDVHQQLCKSIEPEAGATLMGYDAASNLKWSAAGLPAGQVCEANGTAPEVAARRTDRVYDARNRLQTLSFPDGRGNQIWNYTKDGLPATINTYNSNGGDVVTNTYSYNKRRLIEGETFHVGTQLWNLDYNYNASGHLSDYATPGVLVDLAPNALGQPSKAGVYATAVGYFPNGAIKQFTYGNGIQRTLTQNSRGLPDTGCDFAGSSCTASAVLRDSYDYDANGNVLAITDGRTGNRGNRDMSYDALDRLTQTVSPMFGTANYTYDVLDNLKTVQVTAGPKARNHTYIYDASNRLSNVTNTVGGATVTGLGYDVQGNLANKNGVAHTFDYGNRLREVAGAEQYRYDGHGRRVLAIRYGQNLYSLYGQDGVLRFQRDERTGKTIDYVHLGGSFVAQVENAIALSTPVLTAPASSATGTYTVSWTSVAIASSYQLQERLGTGSWSTIHNAAGASKALSGKGNGSWSYQVRACTAASCGSWSPVKTTAVDLTPGATPALSVPASNTTGSYSVSWTTVSLATRYELEERLGTGAWTQIQNTSATSRSITGKATGSWGYRVRACNTTCGSWSAVATVTVLLAPSSAPALTAPASNTTGSYSVSWTTVASATRYELEERLATGTWTQIQNTGATSRSITGKATGSWGYRVRACNTTGCGGWSTVATVAVLLAPSSAPTLTAPGSNATGSYSVSWTTVSSATRYELEERLGTGAWTQIQNTGATSRSISGKATGSWGYRVRACNTTGCGGWSTIATVAVLLPPATAPVLTAPASNATGSYSVSWTAVAAATKYQLQERLGTGSWSTIHDAAGTSKALSGKTSGSWSYQARACNASGCSAYSPLKTVVVTLPPAPATPSWIVIVEQIPDWYVAGWNPSSGATSYELAVAGGATVYSGSASSFEFGGARGPQYAVRACNIGGCSAWSAPVTPIPYTVGPIENSAPLDSNEHGDTSPEVSSEAKS